MARRCPHGPPGRKSKLQPRSKTPSEARPLASTGTARRARISFTCLRDDAGISRPCLLRTSSERRAKEASKKMEKRQGEGGDERRNGGAVAVVEEEPQVERLPADLLAHVLSLLSSFHDLAMAGGVSRRWRRAVERSLAGRRRLSFAGQRTRDDSTARLVRAAVNLRDLDISRSCWGCQITDEGLLKISSAECVGKLTSISLWGLAGITDNGVVHLVSRAHSLQNLNIGGTFITDDSLYAVANYCTNLKYSDHMSWSIEEL